MFYLYVVIFFLWVAIGLYLLLGGADFGAGIVEFFSGKKNKQRAGRIMYKGMGPLWEANHMWLIIVIVILFVAFPQIYALMSTYVHIPLALMLIGIIARGTAFTFRNYDAIKDDGWYKVYNKIFTYASIITPFFLGMIAASTVSQTIDTQANNFLSAYVFSWLTPFGIALGIFTVLICGFLASAYTLNQVTEKEDEAFLVKKTLHFLLAVILGGVLVFIVAFYSGIPVIKWIYSQPLGQIVVVLATVSVIAIYYSIKKRKYPFTRFFSGVMVVMILFAATYNHFPDLILLKNGSISLLENQESINKTIKMLAWALMLGSVFILPGVFHLIYSFQKKKKITI